MMAMKVQLMLAAVLVLSVAVIDVVRQAVVVE